MIDDGQLFDADTVWVVDHYLDMVRERTVKAVNKDQRDAEKYGRSPLLVFFSELDGMGLHRGPGAGLR